jgi:hypothetical protein
MPRWTGQPLAYPTVQKTGAAANLAGLSTTQFAAISSSAIAGLTSTEIISLSTAEIAAFTSTQIPALSTTNLAAAIGGGWTNETAFTGAQISHMTSAEQTAIFG